MMLITTDEIIMHSKFVVVFPSVRALQAQPQAPEMLSQAPPIQELPQLEPLRQQNPWAELRRPQDLRLEQLPLEHVMFRPAFPPTATRTTLPVVTRLKNSRPGCVVLTDDVHLLIKLILFQS